MKNNLTKIASLSLVFAILLTPTLSFAHNKEKGDKENKDKIEGEVRVERSCMKAFGHLISEGFIKNKGEAEFDWQNCFLPRGIAKKIRATSTVDVTAPIISNVTVRTGTTSALLGWKTDENTSAKVYYGTSSPVDVATSSATSLVQKGLRIVHTFFLRELTASTTYYFVAESKDKSGNVSTSTQGSFVTK